MPAWNQAFAGLHLHCIGFSAFISPSVVRVPVSTRISSSHFDHFARPVFQSYYRAGFSAKSSAFQNFLSPAVVVQSGSFEKVEYTARYDTISSDPISFTFCTFKNMTSPQDGGAICLDTFKQRLTVISCGFSFCSCASTGGAIYLFGIEMIIRRSCFSRCSASSRDQSVSSDVHRFSKSVSNPNSIELTHFFECSTSVNQGKRRCVFLAGGNQLAEFINFTANQVKEEGSAITSSFPSNFSLRYTNFILCVGSSLVWLHQLSREYPLDYCNVVDNSAIDNGALITLEDSICQMTGFTFIKNRAMKYIEGTHSVRMINCAFDVPRRAEMFGDIRMNIIDVKFQAKKPTTRLLRLNPTWECWAVGSPSASATAYIPDQVDHSVSKIGQKQKALIALGVIASAAVLGYFLWTFFQAPDYGTLVPIAIKD